MAVSNDFMQYWLGAYLPIGAAADTDAAGLPFLELRPFGYAGVRPQRRRQREEPGQRLLVPDDVRASSSRTSTRSSRASQAIKFDRPPAFDPPDGSSYMYSQTGDATYKRLAKTVDLTGKTSGKLEFKIVVRHRAGLGLRVRRGAHRGPGRLDDAARRERPHQPGPRAELPDTIPYWIELHPFLGHYKTYTGPRRRR